VQNHNACRNISSMDLVVDHVHSTYLIDLP
jgi:hypothetical protein